MREWILASLVIVEEWFLSFDVFWQGPKGYLGL